MWLVERKEKHNTEIGIGRGIEIQGEGFFCQTKPKTNKKSTFRNIYLTVNYSISE